MDISYYLIQTTTKFFFKYKTEDNQMNLNLMVLSQTLVYTKVIPNNAFGRNLLKFTEYM